MLQNLALAALLFTLARALPAPSDSIQTRATTTTTITLQASNISSYLPYTQLAGAVYCSPASTLAWNCGSRCKSVPGFVPFASGGNGASVQYWLVGYHPTLNEIIVSHQGTDIFHITSMLADIDFIQESLNATLFPGIPSSIKAHSGFTDSHARGATQVLAALQGALAKFPTTQVTVTGHSLGAAAALLDSIYLPLHLPSTVSIKVIGFGLPRVGNQAFADYVNSHSVSVTYVSNKKDIVPVIPYLSMGYVHPSGEIHIQDTTDWISCPGQESTAVGCMLAAVPSILKSFPPDHLGPYGGVYLGLC